MKTLVAILTSGKLEKLQRCIDSVLLQVEHSDVVVIINTLDKPYENLASLLAAENGIKSVITESNGKPGKGKNSLISYFLSTDFTHVIPVDGDDFLFPLATTKLSELIHTTNADVIGLIDGLVLMGNNQLPIEIGLQTEEYITKVLRYMDRKHRKIFNLYLARIRRVSNEYGNIFNRFMILSRNAASVMMYDEELSGAEDIKQGLYLKLLHHAGMLKYILVRSENIYLYDMSGESLLFSVFFKANPNEELTQFWQDLSDDQINILKSFQLECIDDHDGFQC